MEIVQQSKDIERFIAGAENIARRTYQRGLGAGFIDNDEMRRRLELAAAKGWLRAYTLYVGDQPVAFYCGRLYKSVMFLDWTGYKSDYQQYEVGTLLFLRIIEYLCEIGVNSVNFGWGHGFFKERFGTDRRTEGWVSIYAPNARGLSANVLNTMQAGINRLLMVATKRLGFVAKVKKCWRARLAESGSNRFPKPVAVANDTPRDHPE